MRSIQNVSRLASRALSTSARNAVTAAAKEPLGPSPKGVIPSDKGYQRVVQIQKLAYENPHIDVWRLFGLRDNLLYYFTLGLMVVSGTYSSRAVWNMIFPKKKDA